MFDRVNNPSDLAALNSEELSMLAQEIRQFIVEKVAVTGGHLGSNLGAVELTIALHRVLDVPRDILLWDTGHQAYVHKILTGRKEDFSTLRQENGLSGYPNRAESAADWIENSHASTALSYAHGLRNALNAAARTAAAACGEADAGAGEHIVSDVDVRVVTVLGDGALTGGMAYEGLNNLGATNSRVMIVLNDNGRSYAPTISRLSTGLSRLRGNPRYMAARNAIERGINNLPGVSGLARASVKGVKAAVREVVEPLAFFEALGVRYIGPIDGHDIAGMEVTFRDALAYPGPIVVHVLTQKGRGYAPAEEDDEKNLHDVKVFNPLTGPVCNSQPNDYTQAFSEALLHVAADFPTVHAITAAMPGPTGLLPFAVRYPDRFHDVGIAEQHAVTMAAGMAMGGLRPIVAVYATFLTRAIDQAMYDVGLHHVPVVFMLDRAGITGPDGASHHGVFDMALALRIPGMTIFAPSSAQEVENMLRTALKLRGPALLRYPRGAARQVPFEATGEGLHARRVAESTSRNVCILSVGRMLESAEDAVLALARDGIAATLWDVRCVKPLDEAMLSDAARHQLVVTIEDGVVHGGVGEYLRAQLSHAECRVVSLGTPDAYLPHASAESLAQKCNLTADGIANTVRAAMDASSSTESSLTEG